MRPEKSSITAPAEEPLAGAVRFTGLRVLFVSDREDAPFTYRCVNAQDQLRSSGATADIAHLDDPELPAVVGAYSVLVLFRLPWSDRVRSVVSSARQAGTPVVFDVDDLVFTPEAEPLLPFLARMSADRVSEYRAVFRGLHRTVQEADACLVTTETLARWIRREGKPAYVHPNLLSTDYVALSRFVYPLRGLLQQRPLLAYLSGSNTHDGDLHSISEPLARFLEQEPSFAFVACGHLEPPRALAFLGERLVRIPYQHRLVYPWLMARARAVLAPIETVNDFTDAKSPLKVFEAGVFGVPVIASPTAPYRDAVEHGSSGFIASSPAEWSDALAKLVDRRHADALGRRARQIALARFTPNAHRDALARVLLEVAGSSPERNRGSEAGSSLRTVRRRVGLNEVAGLGRATLRMAIGLRPIAHPLIAPLLRAPASTLIDASHPAVRLLAVAHRDGRLLVHGRSVVGVLLCDRTGGLFELSRADDVLPVTGRVNTFRCVRGGSWFALEAWPERADRPRAVVVRMRVRSAARGVQGKIYWTRAGEHFSEARAIAFPVEPDGEMRTILIRLDGDGGAGRSSVGALRLDPVDAPAEVEIAFAAVLTRVPTRPSGQDLRDALEERFLEGHPRGGAVEVDAADASTALGPLLRATPPGDHVVLAMRTQGALPPRFEDALHDASRANDGTLVELVGEPETGAYVAVMRRAEARAIDTPTARGVDIVVPVYNAPDDTLACLESVLRHATGDWRLVLVDDASPDPRIPPLLARFGRADSRVVVLTNERNLGFVGTANRGIRNAGTRDVLLLNSDTEVFEGFLDRLRAAAYADPDTGVVTPFSNNATICSVPEFPKPNPIPEGFTPETFAALVSACSLRRRPELVTGVGFCMYVKRSVFERVGDLDEETFGRGFGEENDLCQRARKAGYSVRLCDDTFVYHKGKASFGEEGHELDQRNARRLEAKHPGYHAEVAVFIETNPLQDLHDNLRFHMRRRRRGAESAMLFVLHSSPFARDRGGTEHHVRDLVRTLALRRVVLAYPATGGIAAAEILDGRIDEPTHYLFTTPSAPRFAIDFPAIEGAFREMIDVLEVRSAHLHHLMFWPLRIGGVLRAQGVPYLVTCHDYYTVCPSWNLYDYGKDVSCRCVQCGDTADPGCLPALFANLGGEPDDLALFRQQHRAGMITLLSDARGVAFPSSSARDVLLERLPLDPCRLYVIPHGLDLPAPAERLAPGERLRIAVIGEVAHQIKGAQQYLELVHLTCDLPVEWHFFGPTERFGFEQRVRAANHPAVVFHGPYLRDQLPDALASAGIDVGLLLPRWPETFSYVLSELLVAGIPAVVADLGAPAERVRATGAGVVVRSTAEAVTVLGVLAHDRSRVARLAEAARRQPSRSVAESAAEHRALYDALGMLPDQAQVDPPDPERLHRVAAHRVAWPARRAVPSPRSSTVGRVAARVKPYVPAPIWTVLRAGWRAARG